MGINLVEAKKYIETALEEEPEDGYIMDSLAWVYFKMGQHRKALETIEKAIKRVPRDPVIHEHLGDIYKALDKARQAVEAYQKAIEFQHTEPDKIRRKIESLQ
jgi:tetratricopeptide (TPR) repeat protein